MGQEMHKVSGRSCDSGAHWSCPAFNGPSLRICPRSDADGSTRLDCLTRAESFVYIWRGGNALILLSAHSIRIHVHSQSMILSCSMFQCNLRFPALWLSYRTPAREHYIRPQAVIELFLRHPSIARSLISFISISIIHSFSAFINSLVHFLRLTSPVRRSFL
jgi:hypothetical protein